MASNLTRQTNDRDPRQLSVKEIEAFRRLIAVLGEIVAGDSRRSENVLETGESERLGSRQKSTNAVALSKGLPAENHNQNESHLSGDPGVQRKSHQESEFGQSLPRGPRGEPELEMAPSLSSAELKAKLDALTTGTLDRCPKCHRRRPGTKPARATTPREISSSLRHAVRWARTMKTDRSCPTCVGRKHARKSRILSAFRRVSRVMKSSFWFYAVLPALVLCIVAAILILNMDVSDRNLFYPENM